MQDDVLANTVLTAALSVLKLDSKYCGSLAEWNNKQPEVYKKRLSAVSMPYAWVN